MKERMPQSAAKMQSMESTLSQPEKDVIRELEFPIHRILNQMRPELEEGAYRLIIGDDVSGRIPAIAMNEAIRKIYKAYGHPPPMLRFVAAGRRKYLANENKKQLQVALRDSIQERAKGFSSELLDANESPRALFVTEAIMYGKGIKYTIDALTRERIRTDIATIAHIGGDIKKTRSIFKHSQLFAGLIAGDEVAPRVYGPGMRYLQGVQKENDSAVSSRFKDYLIHKEERQMTQESVNASRVLAISVGSDVADTFLVGTET